MNPDTGHLVDLRSELLSEDEMRERGYEPVPAGRLSNRARKLLAGRGEMTVPLTDPLTRAMKRIRALRKKAERQARKRGRR
jgi:hypothetical protein